MDRLHAMIAFVRVADVGGFARAARELNLSPAAVTRAVSALEDLIGVPLFVRTTRSVRLTQAGEQYLEDCRRILAEIEEAEASAAGVFAAPFGALTVSASALFGRMYVLPILQEYLALNQQVTARALFVDRVTHMIDEGIDVAIRIGALPDSSLSAARVGRVRHIVCAAPDYLARHGTPMSPAELAGHRIIATSAAWTAVTWRFGTGTDAINVVPTLTCNTNDAAIAAAVAGIGLTRVLNYQAAELIAAGALRTVLTDAEPPPYPIHVLHAEGRRTSAKVRAFVDLAVERLRANDFLN
ncbi:MAG: LysR family transcriptional regulator [Sphingobium sp.]|nr:LysR family transcriptional regulator [Sphingobium sp.]